MWPFKKHTDDLSRLDVAILFVTSRCNARCSTCFYWRELNNEEGVMTLDEIRRLSASLPRFTHLLLSGGEPTLRDDIADIVAVFARNNAIATADMPTNGLLPQRTVDFAGRVLTENPNLRLTIGLSLDGLAETHDALRGVPGCFDKLFETARLLNDLRARAAAAGQDWDRRLALAVVTCLNDRNFGEYPRLIDYVRAHADVDQMVFEPLRGQKKDAALRPPSPEAVREAARLSLQNNRALIAKRNKDEMGIRLANLEVLHETQARYLETGRLPLTCMAGRRVAVVEHNAALQLCELLDPVANLRDFDFDFKAAWNCRAAVRQRRWIEKTPCSCGHCVIVGHSLGDDPVLRRAIEEKAACYSREE